MLFIWVGRSNGSSDQMQADLQVTMHLRSTSESVYIYTAIYDS